MCVCRCVWTCTCVCVCVGLFWWFLHLLSPAVVLRKSWNVTNPARRRLVIPKVEQGHGSHPPTPTPPPTPSTSHNGVCSSSGTNLSSFVSAWGRSPGNELRNNNNQPTDFSGRGFVLNRGKKKSAESAHKSAPPPLVYLLLYVSGWDAIIQTVVPHVCFKHQSERRREWRNDRE